MVPSHQVIASTGSFDFMFTRATAEENAGEPPARFDSGGHLRAVEAGPFSASILKRLQQKRNGFDVAHHVS